MEPPTWRRGPFEIGTDRDRLDVPAIWAFLRTSYWARGIPLAVVERSVEHSLPFGLYRDAEQIGFARVITDYATFAYLADVFVLEPFRGQGLGRWLVDTVTRHPALQGLRRWMLVTRDAQGLYRRCGFSAISDPERVMERRDPDVYLRGTDGEAQR